MDESLRRTLVEAQRSEIAERHVYRGLARREKDSHNREVLERIGEDELRHYGFWAGRPNPGGDRRCSSDSSRSTAWAAIPT